MTELLIIEDLFLLMHDDESGKASGGTMAPEAALAGALLLDLAEQGLVRADGKHLVPTGAPAAHPLAAEALAVLAASAKPRDAGHWVGRLPRALKPFDAKVGRSLVARGVLAETQAKVLGLFTTTRWPERDPEPERRLRAGLADVLAHDVAPSPRQELLIPLLAATDLVPTLVEKADRKAAKARAKAIGDAAKDGRLVSAAVSQSVAATQAAVMVAIMTPVIVSTVISS